MSQHKKQDKPAQVEVITRFARGEEDTVSLDGGTTCETKTAFQLTNLLKAIYRDGATATPRNLSKDVQAITDLFTEQA